MPIGSVFLRALASMAVIAVGITLAVISAIPYGGGGTFIMLTMAATLFLVAWTLLPLVRWNRVVAVVLVTLWVVAGVSLLSTGQPYSGNPFFSAWLVSSVVLGIGLRRHPPTWAAPRPAAQLQPLPLGKRLPRYAYTACVCIVFASCLDASLSPWIGVFWTDHFLLWNLLSQYYLFPPFGGAAMRPFVLVGALVVLLFVSRRVVWMFGEEALPPAFRGLPRMLTYAGLAFLVVSTAQFCVQAAFDYSPRNFVWEWLPMASRMLLPWAVVLTEAADLLHRRRRPVTEPAEWQDTRPAD